MTDASLSESLSTLSRFLVGDHTLEETLQRVAELATKAVPPTALVGLTLSIEGSQRTAVFTDDVAPEIDRAQYDAGAGPCLDALRHRQAVAIDAMAEDDRWPAFRDAALARGIHSTLSLPLVVDDASVGAANFYAHEPDAYPAATRSTASLFASQAAIVLANAHAYGEVFSLSERLGEAMRSRAVIEQAKGMLMRAQQCDEEQAFELLVQASQRENVKLRDIARRIVDEAVRPGAGSTPHDAQGGPAR